MYRNNFPFAASPVALRKIQEFGAVHVLHHISRRTCIAPNSLIFLNDIGEAAKDKR